MRSVLKKQYQNTARALGTLEEILETSYSVIVRDAAIQRFEYCVEALWKYIKRYLAEQEGIECYSPKSCFRELHSLGICDEDEVVQTLEMIDDRNRTSHTYHEKLADTIYRNLPEYLQIMQRILQRLQSEETAGRA